MICLLVVRHQMFHAFRVSLPLPIAQYNSFDVCVYYNMSVVVFAQNSNSRMSYAELKK